MKDNDFEREITEDSHRKPTQDKLDFVRDQIRYFRDLEKRIQDAEEIVKVLKAEKRELQFSTLPTLFMQNRINALSLSEEGNLPAYDAEIKDYYHAKLPSDSPDAHQAAISWLEKHKLGDIIKTIFTIEIGRGNAKLTRAVQAALRTLKVPFSQQQSVPWNTLTAAIRERYRDNKPLKNAEKEILGATVSKIVTLKPAKEK